jgi:hypothetical protein
MIEVSAQRAFSHYYATATRLCQVKERVLQSLMIVSGYIGGLNKTEFWLMSAEQGADDDWIEFCVRRMK